MRFLPAILLSLAAIPLLPAQEATITARDLMVKGGNLMFVLLFLSLVAVMLMVYYCLSLRRSVLAPAKFLHEAEDAAEAGDWELLEELARKDGSLAAKAVLAASQERPNGLEEARKAMEEEGARQTAILWGRLQYLMDVASIAPMVGLLGTVWGMMVSFLALDTDLAMANKVSNLTSGVSQAMFTTFGGLVIAIFSLAAYALFRGRLNRLTAQVEVDCKAVLRRFKKA